MVDFASNLRELRAFKGLTQQELADQVGLSISVIRNLEGGRSNPSISFLFKLADFFDVTTDFLIGREDDFGNLINSPSYEQNQNDERYFLYQYRKLSENEKKAVNKLIETLSDK